MPKLLWSYPAKAGRRATRSRPSSMVKVYERADVPGTIWMERAWITTDKGNPIPRPLAAGTTQRGAEILCEETALARERRILEGVDEFGEKPEDPAPTVSEVLDAYHESRDAMAWSQRHRKEQDRCRRFIIELLGGDRPAGEIPPGEIEKRMGEAAEARGWTSTRTERRYLQYLRSAGRWAYRKGELVDKPLWMAVDLPRYRPDTTERVYSVEQSRLLFTPHPEVDWRVTLAAAIAADTGRRISAIAGIWAGGEEHPDPPSDLAVMDFLLQGRTVERMWIRFRGQTDKGGRTAIRPVSEETRELIERALERSAVRSSGWLFPEGRLDQVHPIDKPMSASSLIKRLHSAEDALGIERVHRRGYHGIKKRHVTVGFQVSGGDETLVGDLVGNLDMSLLRGTYRQEDLERILRHAEEVAAVFKGREPGHELGHDQGENEGRS